MIPKFLYPVFFAINNYLFFPFFSWFQFTSENILQPVILGLYYTTVTTAVIALPFWWLLRKKYRSTTNPLWVLLAVFTETAVLFVMLISSFLGINTLLYNLGLDGGVLSMYLPLATYLVAGFILVSATIQQLISRQTKKPIKLNFFFEPFSVVLSVLLPSILFGLIALTFWFDSGSHFCAEQQRLYVSSGYSAHSNQLCYHRTDKSECPQTEGELRAFKPEVYDQLLACYQPTTTENGFFLISKLWDYDIF
jgi:hypothetical protein